MKRPTFWIQPGDYGWVIRGPGAPAHGYMSRNMAEHIATAMNKKRAKALAQDARDVAAAIGPGRTPTRGVNTPRPSAGTVVTRQAAKPKRRRRRNAVPAKQMRFPFVGKECHVEGEFKICEGYNDALQVAFEPRDGSADATLSARKSGTYKGMPRWEVGGAYVPYPMLDKGIGTRLYEKMMEAVRKRGGVFTSSDVRSVFSEAFWKKQKRKGRAECGDWDNPASYYSNPLTALEEACEYGYGDGETIPKEVCKRLLDIERPDSDEDGWPCGFWALKMPMPTTLGKLKKRKR